MHSALRRKSAYISDHWRPEADDDSGGLHRLTPAQWFGTSPVGFCVGHGNAVSLSG